MVFLDWIINNYLEIAVTLGLTVGIYFLIQINISIKSQRTSFGNKASGNKVYNLQDSTFNQNNFNSFEEKTKEKILEFPTQKKEELTSNKKIFDNIEQKLGENYSITLLCSLCSRLAKNLNSEKWADFFDNELNGYTDIKAEKEAREKGISFRKIKKGTIHRSIFAKLHIQFKNRPLDTFDLRMFLSMPIEKIENLSKGDPTDELIMTAPPASLMVETLKVDPNKNVPYIIKRSSFQEIVIELKTKIRNFLREIEPKIK